MAPKLLIILFLIGLPLAFLPACGNTEDSSQPSNHPLGVAPSDEGHFTITATHDPETPVSGENALELVVASTQHPVEGLTLSVEPWMPGHGHGSSMTPTVSDQGAGIYRVENLVYTMPGLWEARITITGEAVSDTITFEFDVH